MPPPPHTLARLDLLISSPRSLPPTTAGSSRVCAASSPSRTRRPLINLVYEFGDVERNPSLRTLAIHLAQQMENRLEAYDLCVNKELWEGALQVTSRVHLSIKTGEKQC